MSTLSAKEKVSILFSHLDMSKMDLFKVVHHSQLVDEDARTSSGPEDSVPAKDTQDKDGATEEDESGAPQQEDVIREEEIQEENRWLGFSL